MAGRTTIEINGKIYDAATGSLVKSRTATKSKSTNKITSNQRRFIDGVHGPINKVKSKPAAANKPISKAASKASPAKPATPAAQNKSRTAAPPAKRQPKKSQTLHRRSVNRPVKTSTKSKSPKAVSKPVQRSKSSSSVNTSRKVDIKRLDKAKAVKRSNAISRFSTENKSQKSNKGLAIRPQKLHQHVSAAREKARKQQQATASQKTQAAATRKAPRFKKRLAGTGMTVLAAIVLTGYVAYLNLPGISMRVASHRAGFAASLPSAPAGYSLGSPIASSSGLVTVDFKSNTDQRHFTLKQQPSSWDSQALLENEITKNHNDYVTYQDRGLTIYVYDGSNASWVNAGKLFSIHSENSQLTVDQILAVAASM